MEEVNIKLKELLDTLDHDERVISVKQYKEKLLHDEVFLNKIRQLQTLDMYSDEYLMLKQELFQNPDFVAFKHYENEINLLILVINQKLKLLTDERGCNHENH